MEEKNTQYTFAPEEKEILEKLEIVESGVSEKLNKENGELISTKYYEEFIINTKRGPVTLKELFITTEKNQEGKISFHFRWINEKTQTIEEKIIVDSEGRIYTIPELQEFIGDLDINIEELMAENEKEKGRLKGLSEKAESKDIEFNSNQENEIAFSNKLNRFVIISKEDGKYKLNDNIEPAKTTMKSIISIDENGEKIERKVPHALMKTNNPEQEIAITIGQYGAIDIETVKVLPCKERIARGIRTQGEGIEKEESYEIRQEQKAEGKEYDHKIAHQVQEIEQEQRKNGEISYQITEEDYIPNTKKTWGELVEETGESLIKLVERYNREITKEGAKPEKVIQIIEEDYMNVFKDRKR